MIGCAKEPTPQELVEDAFNNWDIDMLDADMRAVVHYEDEMGSVEVELNVDISKKQGISYYVGQSCIKETIDHSETIQEIETYINEAQGLVYSRRGDLWEKADVSQEERNALEQFLKSIHGAKFSNLVRDKEQKEYYVVNGMLECGLFDFLLSSQGQSDNVNVADVTLQFDKRTRELKKIEFILGEKELEKQNAKNASDDSIYSQDLYTVCNLSFEFHNAQNLQLEIPIEENLAKYGTEYAGGARPRPILLGTYNALHTKNS